MADNQEGADLLDRQIVDLKRAPCSRCGDLRIIEFGDPLEDGRGRLIVCPRCGGAGPVRKAPECFKPRAGLSVDARDLIELMQRRALQGEKK